MTAHWALLIVVVSTCLAWLFIRPPSTLLMFYRSVSTHQILRPVRFVPLKQIPVSVRWMLVNLEDYTFYQHHGIDFEAIKGAVRVNKIIGYPLYGGSTITQQLARSLYLTTHKSYVRKYLEAIIALGLEAILGKERILELYFNYVEWGPGVFGIGAQSAHDLALQIDDAGSSLLAGFHSGLVIGVDVNQAGVQTHRALEKGHQSAHHPGIDARDGDRHGLAVVLEQGRARAQEEAVQVVAGRDAGVYLLGRPTRFQDADEDGEEVGNSLAQLLDVGMLVRGAFVAVHGQSLIDAPTLQVELLAQRLHDQLLKIAAQ